MAGRNRAWYQDADSSPLHAPAQLRLPANTQNQYQSLRHQLALCRPIQSTLVSNTSSFSALNLIISVSNVPDTVLAEFTEFKKAVGWSSSHSRREGIQELKQFSRKMHGQEAEEDDIPDSLLDLFLGNWEKSKDEVQAGQWPFKAKGGRGSRRRDTGEG